MKWSLLALLALFLVVLLATGVALILYVRHWASRERRLAANDPRLEGVYFKRYVPVSLREKYDRLRTISASGRRWRTRALRITLTGSIGIAVLVFAAVPFVMHMDKFKAPIDLSDVERSRLLFARHDWLTQEDQEDNDGLDLRSLLGEVKGLVLVSSPDDMEWMWRAQRVNRLATTHWANFVKEYNLELQLCGWKGLLACQKEGEKWIWVILPGRWEFAALEALVASGASVILYGAPAQVVDEKDKRIEWAGLTFESRNRPSDSGIVLRGDQILTLGLDAGLRIEAAPLFGGYRVFSSDPQAISAGADSSSGHDVETRLFAAKAGAGRLVWMDFPPHPGDHYEEINVDNLNALMSRVFGYLLRQSYSAWATWPAGTKFAGFISEDTEDKFLQAKNVVNIVRQKGFPITWFMLSNLALEHRDLTRELAAVGEVACHGDSHLPFSLNTLEEQTIRLARCQKVLKELTGEMPIGFRPPEERFNGDTIDALLNVGMDYLFADNDAAIAVPQIVATNDPNASLVSLPRKAEDDYSLWEVGKLDFQRSVAVIDRDMAAMEQVGGLYGFSFHSQYMDDADNLRIVMHVGEKLQERQAYFSTGKRIAAWWRLRDALIRGKQVDEILFDYFEPVQLTVTAEGELVRTEEPNDAEGKTADSAVTTEHAPKKEGS